VEVAGPYGGGAAAAAHLDRDLDLTSLEMRATGVDATFLF
jgi:hypothetical protein